MSENGSLDQTVDDEINFIPSRKLRYRQALKHARENGYAGDEKVKQHFQKQKLFQLQEMLDGALAFDDNLGRAIVAIEHIIPMLYRDYKNNDEFECLRLVRQIAMAPDRPWTNKDSNKSQRIREYDDLQKVALYILFDHQRRSQDIDLAKNLAQFLGKRTKSGIPLPDKIELDLKYSDFYDLRKGPHEGLGRGEILSVFEFIHSNDLPEFTEWLYDQRSPLFPIMCKKLPGSICGYGYRPGSEKFLSCHFNEVPKIAVDAFQKRELLDWAIQFTKKVQEGDFCSNVGRQAYKNFCDIRDEGLKTLDSMMEELEKVKRQWRRHFSG